MQNFEIGDWVYAGDWCYGQIQEIDNDIVYVEYSTVTGGGNFCFELSELQPAPSPDEHKVSIRDNMLVTAGTRAAYMDYRGDIEIPCSLDGEDELADFITKMVDAYIKDNDDTPFDWYIENRLMDKYGKGE